MVVMLSCFEEVIAVCASLPGLLGAAVVAGRAALPELLETAGAKKRFLAPRCKQNLEPILSSRGLSITRKPFDFLPGFPRSFPLLPGMPWISTIFPEITFSIAIAIFYSSIYSYR